MRTMPKNKSRKLAEKLQYETEDAIINKEAWLIFDEHGSYNKVPKIRKPKKTRI